MTFWEKLIIGFLAVCAGLVLLALVAYLVMVMIGQAPA